MGNEQALIPHTTDVINAWEAAFPSNPVITGLEQSNFSGRFPTPTSPSDIPALLESCMQGSNPTDITQKVREALRAEIRGQSTELLRKIMRSIIGIKLIAIERGDQDLYVSSEQQVIKALRGDTESGLLVSRAIEHVIKHDSGWRENMAETSGDIIDSGDVLGFDKLSMVHVTKYLPRSSDDGTLRIMSTYDATGEPRNTIHVALNAHVESSYAASGSQRWIEDCQVAIIAPMDKVVEKNGLPSDLHAYDTWWETPPGEGLILPDDAIVVRPGAGKPVQPHGSNEIRYQNIIGTDAHVTEAFGRATDYELGLLAYQLGMGCLPVKNDYSCVGTDLPGTTLRQYVEKFEDESFRQQIYDKLLALKISDRESANKLYGYLNRMVAVRTAIEQQGSQAIIPLNIMHSMGFRSDDLSQGLLRLAFSVGFRGNHSETFIYDMEKSTIEASESRKDGRPILSDQARTSLHNQLFAIRPGSSPATRGYKYLASATLEMYYRLGVF